MTDLDASNMKTIAEDFNKNIENKATESYMKRIQAAAQGGAFHLYINNELTKEQIDYLKGLNYTVCKTIHGLRSVYKISWR